MSIILDFGLEVKEKVGLATEATEVPPNGVAGKHREGCWLALCSARQTADKSRRTLLQKRAFSTEARLVHRGSLYAISLSSSVLQAQNTPWTCLARFSASGEPRIILTGNHQRLIKT